MKDERILECLTHCSRRGISTTLASLSWQLGEPLPIVEAQLSAMQTDGAITCVDERYLRTEPPPPLPPVEETGPFLKLKPQLRRFFDWASERQKDTDIVSISHFIGESAEVIQPHLDALIADDELTLRDGRYYVTHLADLLAEPVEKPVEVIPHPTPAMEEREAELSEIALPEDIEDNVAEDVEPDEPPEPVREPVELREHPIADMQTYLKSKGDAVVEVRIFRKSAHMNGRFRGHSVFGYFDDFVKLERAIAPFMSDTETEGIYTSLQRVHPELLARANNRIKQARTGDTTKNHEIEALTIFPMDIDGERFKGISASRDEIIESKSVAEEIRAWFAERGIETYFAFSGNGWHVLIYMNPVPHNDEVQTRFESCGKRVCERWDVDTKNFNSARVWKLYGTVARKSDETEDRKHRRSMIRIPDNPVDIQRYDFDVLEEIISELPLPSDDAPGRTQAVTNGTQAFPIANPSVIPHVGKRIPQITSKEDFQAFFEECGGTASGRGEWKKMPDGWWKLRVNCPACGGADYGMLSYAEMTNAYSFSCSGNTCGRNGTNLATLYTKAGFAKAQMPVQHRAQYSKLELRIHKVFHEAENRYGDDLPPLSEWEQIQIGDENQYFVNVPCCYHDEDCEMRIIIASNGIIVESAHYICGTNLERGIDMLTMHSEKPDFI